MKAASLRPYPGLMWRLNDGGVKTFPPPSRSRQSHGAATIESPATGTMVVEAYADVPDSTMFPAEAAMVAGAVAERRREFATVRHCARLALQRLGLTPGPILADADGVPSWPDGVVGSLTHCPGYRAAALARATRLASIGIDAEPHAALPTETLDLVLRSEELEHRDVLTAAFPRLHWDRVMFCVKEAVYKAWFPMTRRWLGFDEVATVLRPDGTFEVSVRVQEHRAGGLDLSRFEGRWAVDRGLVVAITCVPRGGRSDGGRGRGAES
jgi:4'-phosphopantetheinyl transferase EntD